MLQTLFALLAAAAPVPKELADKPPTAEAVADALRALYPVVGARPAGVLVFDPKSKIAELKTPALVRADPGLRLFRTPLNTEIGRAHV